MILISCTMNAVLSSFPSIPFLFWIIYATDCTLTLFVDENELPTRMNTVCYCKFSNYSVAEHKPLAHETKETKTKTKISKKQTSAHIDTHRHTPKINNIGRWNEGIFHTHLELATRRSIELRESLVRIFFSRDSRFQNHSIKYCIRSGDSGIFHFCAFLHSFFIEDIMKYTS